MREKHLKPINMQEPRREDAVHPCLLMGDPDLKAEQTRSGMGQRDCGTAAEHLGCVELPLCPLPISSLPPFLLTQVPPQTLGSFLKLPCPQLHGLRKSELPGPLSNSQQQCRQMFIFSKLPQLLCAAE